MKKVFLVLTALLMLTLAGCSTAAPGTGTLTVTGSWASSDLPSQCPPIPTPAGTQVTSFTSYALNLWHFVAYPFTVNTTGTYSVTASTPVVTNTTWILTGLFSAGQPPTTPIGNFLAGVFSPSSNAPYVTSITNLSLIAGQQYTVLVAYNIGGVAGEVSTVTITGPAGSTISSTQ